MSHGGILSRCGTTATNPPYEVLRSGQNHKFMRRPRPHTSLSEPLKSVEPSAVTVGIEVRYLVDWFAGCWPVAPARPTEWHDAARRYGVRQMKGSSRRCLVPERQSDQGSSQAHGARCE